MKYQQKKCRNCGNTKVFNKKRGLCWKCYQKAYKSGEIPPLPRFTRRIKDQWGPEIIDDIAKIEAEDGMNLSDLGRKYGFSREYARQIFKRIYKKGIKTLDKGV